MSTCHALVDLIDGISQSLDAKNYAVEVSSLIKKAFDTVNNQLLYNKNMEFLCIRGVAYKWLNSYLEYRKQFVSIDKWQSAVRNISSGVPQGSLLGHKLFILYVNDMCNIYKLVKHILFADDTKPKKNYADDNIKRLSDTECSVLEKNSTRFAVNRLTLNIYKTNYMLFGNRIFSEDVVINT